MLTKVHLVKAMVFPVVICGYAECIMLNAGLDEAQAGIKIVGRNITKLRYADDITTMAEGKRN